jgi:predicted  nucleic acid-binding Zn-ribbon protein
MADEDRKQAVHQKGYISSNPAAIEFESLEAHVAISRERHDEINSRFNKVDQEITKLETELDDKFTKLERVIFWSMGTLFITLLGTLFTIIAKGL